MIGPLPIMAALATEAGYVGADASIQVLEVFEKWSVQQAFFVRMSITLTICIPTLYLFQIPERPLGPPVLRVQLLMWARALAGYLCATFSYMALERLGLSEALSIWSLRPFPTMFFCFIFMGERVSRLQMLVAVTAFFGVIMIAYPRAFGSSSPFTEDQRLPQDPTTRTIGVICALGGAVFSGVTVCCSRAVAKHVHTLQALTAYAALAASLSPIELVVHPGTWSPPQTAISWFAIAGVVASGIISNLTEIYACREMPGGLVTTLGYSGVVMSVITQWIIYHNHPSWPAYIGMLIIIVSGIVAVLYGPKQVEGEKSPKPLSDAEEGLEEPLLEDSGHNVHMTATPTSASKAPSRDSGADSGDPHSPDLAR